MLQGEQRAVATNVVAMIERMRPRPAVNADGSTADGNAPTEPKRPHDIEGQWLTIKRLLLWLMDNAGGPLSPPSEVASPFHGPGAAAPRVATGSGGGGGEALSSAPRVAAHFNLERPAPSVPPPAPPSESAPLEVPLDVPLEAAFVAPVTTPAARELDLLTSAEDEEEEDDSFKRSLQAVVSSGRSSAAVRSSVLGLS